MKDNGRMSHPDLINHYNLSTRRHNTIRTTDKLFDSPLVNNSGKYSSHSKVKEVFYDSPHGSNDDPTPDRKKERCTIF